MNENITHPQQQQECPHQSITVLYMHPWGNAPGVPLAELQTSDPALTRPCMTISAPRCIACGKLLGRAELGTRIGEGGDLYDPRFEWAYVGP